MNIVIAIFNEVLYRPIFNLLVFLYNTLPGNDFGLAIIVLTVFTRLILFPLSQKSIKSQKVLTELQPQIKDIQKKYKDDKEMQARAMMEFYKKYKVNPMSGCLPLLVQFPILIALYRAFIDGLNPGQLNGLYGWVANPGSINPMFLGVVNLSVRNPILAVLAGALQFIQSKMLLTDRGGNYGQSSTKGDKLDISHLMGKQMTYFMPMMTVFIAWNFPAGLPLYWGTATLFTIIQQFFVKNVVDSKKLKK